MPTSIAGDGFIVRQPAESDAEALGELVGDPEHAAEVVASWVGHWEVDGYGSWVVEGADGALLGFVGVRPREEDIALTIRSSAAAAADGRAAAVLRLVVAHSLEWLPDAPLRLRVGADDPATQALAESAGLVHVEQQDHEAKGRRWHVLESPYPRSFSRLPEAPRAQLRGLWTRVNDAGGSVGFLPGASAGAVEAELDRRAAALESGTQTGLALMSPTGSIIGVGFLRRATNELMSHARVAEAVMIDPQRQGRGHGRQLMAVLHRAAREQGVELLTLDYRDGDGLGDFYGQLGYREVGRVPGLIRVAEGDDRDSVTLVRRLD